MQPTREEVIGAMVAAAEATVAARDRANDTLREVCRVAEEAIENNILDDFKNAMRRIRDLATPKEKTMQHEGGYVMEDESPATPMPQYQCHKKVWALKVESVSSYEPGVFARLHFEDERYAPRDVSGAFVDRHLPASSVKTGWSGWYFVVYEDGYESMSPPEAFESGYTLIG